MSRRPTDPVQLQLYLAALNRAEREDMGLRIAAIRSLLEEGAISPSDADYLHPDVEFDGHDLEDKLNRLLKCEMECLRERWMREGKDHGDTEKESA